MSPATCKQHRQNCLAESPVPPAVSRCVAWPRWWSARSHLHVLWALSRPPRHAVYHVQFHRLNETCNWEHTLLYFDGSHRVHTHDWQGGNSRWRDSHASMVYPLAANKQFYARAWNGCWSNWNTSAHYTQFFAMYVGAIPA